MNGPSLRPYSRRRRAFAALAAAVAALVLDGMVAAHAPDPALSGGAFGQDQVLRFEWRAGSTPPAAHRTAILAAAADVTATRASRAARFEFDAAGPNPIGYGDGATCSPAGIACFTRTVPTGFTMWFREQGHVFDWGTLKWCQSYEQPPNGCYDVENIALDEFGHIEGLGHHVNLADGSDFLDAVVQTYSRAKPAAGWNAHALGRCDVATLQRLYDVINAATPISTCLDLSTKLSLSARSTSIPYGGDAVLTATLRIADSSSYGLLRNNLLSSRTVSLQRRPAGASSWTTIGAMTAGSSGTYTSTIRLQSTTEFRAVFSSPASEGLRGSTSGAVKVAVGSCQIAPCPLSGTGR